MPALFPTFRSLFTTTRFELPPLSPARDAYDSKLICTLGLARTWNFFSHRFSPEGHGILLATAAWFLWGMNALELQAYVPLLYAGCLWLIAAAALRIAKPRVQIEAAHTDRVSAGQGCAVTLQLRGPRALNARVIPRGLPAGLDYAPVGGAALTETGDGWKASLSIEAARRGVYTLRGWRALSDYPFGVLNVWQEDKREARLTVVPAFTPLTSLELGAGRTGTGGAENLRHRGEVDEFSGNRPFRQGDAIRHIDWRSTARLQNLVVREWNSQPLLRAAVVLDTVAPDSQDALFERAVSLCAAVADYLARTGYTVDLFAAGDIVHHLQTGPNAAYLDEILDLLACVQRSAKPGPTSPLAHVTPLLEGVDTLVFIALDTERSREKIEEITASGCALHTLVVCDTQPAVADPTSTYVPAAAQNSGSL